MFLGQEPFRWTGSRVPTAHTHSLPGTGMHAKSYNLSGRCAIGYRIDNTTRPRTIRGAARCGVQVKAQFTGDAASEPASPKRK